MHITRTQDTIASMAGAVAGAFYGEALVPVEWSAACEAKERALTYAECLFARMQSENEASTNVE